MEERLVRPAWPEGPELLKMGQFATQFADCGVLSPSPAALANGGEDLLRVEGPFLAGRRL